MLPFQCHFGVVTIDSGLMTGRSGQGTQTVTTDRNQRSRQTRVAGHDRLEYPLGTYTFNKHVIKHHFCLACGVHLYGEGVDEKGNRTAAINIRCLENIDLASVQVQNFDGR